MAAHAAHVAPTKDGYLEGYVVGVVADRRVPPVQFAGGKDMEQHIPGGILTTNYDCVIRQQFVYPGACVRNNGCKINCRYYVNCRATDCDVQDDKETIVHATREMMTIFGTRMQKED